MEELILNDITENTVFSSTRELSKVLRSDDNIWKLIFAKAFRYEIRLKQDFKSKFSFEISNPTYNGFLKLLKRSPSFRSWFSPEKQRSFCFKDPDWIKHQKESHRSKETVDKFRSSFNKARLLANPDLFTSLKEKIEEINNVKVLDTPTLVSEFRAVCPQHGVFTTHLLHGGGHIRGEILSCPRCSHGTKLQEMIFTAIISKGVHAAYNFRGKQSPFYMTQISNQEMDIFLPELKVAFEINGAYSHNTAAFAKKKPKPRRYHATKTEIAMSKGITLYHIWEHWDKEISLSIVMSKLGFFNEKYYARSLNLKIYTSIEPNVRLFFAKNHILNEAPCTASITLESNQGEIITALQYVETECNILITRNATKRFTSVIGGFKRLFNKLRMLSRKQIITYAIRDLTPDYKNSCYFRAGFSCMGDSGPTLSYYVHRTIYKGKQPFIHRGVYNRQQFMKKRISRWPTLSVDSVEWIFNSEETEQENLARLQIYPVYNSGCWKFVYKQ